MKRTRHWFAQPAACRRWALAITSLIVSWGYIEDDAFIHIEFAQNLAHGRGFTFDGRHVYGDSSPAWVLLLAAFLRAGMSFVYAAKAASVLGWIACAVGVARLGSVLLAKPAYRAAWRLFVALNPFTLLWLYARMGRWPPRSAPGSWRRPWLRRFPVDGSRGSPTTWSKAWRHSYALSSCPSRSPPR